MAPAAVAQRDTRKPDRRAALETPYKRDNERSLMEAMDRGREPRTLPDLVAWYRGCLANETPVALHRAGVWRDHGEHAEGGSHLGSPPFTDAFRRLLEGSPHECDEDGFYVRPIRSALARMSRRHPLTAQHLWRLAIVDGDWRRYAEFIGWEHEEMEVYLARALQMLWRGFATRKLLMRYD